ncbi:hypothetical protein Bbelb_172260 [Branchiostoma belcheri]|nr:hypothetical protein Bbelb_172260 [Branchiostoma belcheri]
MLSSGSVISHIQRTRGRRPETCRGYSELKFGRSEMATTAPKGDDRSEKRRRPFGKATTVYETEICLAATSGNNEHCPGNAGRPAVSETGLLFTLISKQTHDGTTWI